MIRLLHSTIAAACLLATSFLAVPQAFAQGREMNIADQPGYVPNEAEEELPPEYKRTAVFYRTTEAPGTIVISTSERFLYLIQGNGRALR
jgi:lipoprotein-anchoring transpeptidase ErfK/SrfK